MVKVYIAKTDDLNNDELYGKLYGMIPRERQQRADRLFFRKDKNLCVAAGVILKIALEKEGIQDFEIEYRENGKPYLKENEIFFNLSHSDGVVMCAISNADVGCDAEKVREIDLSIAKRFFTESEFETLEKKETDEEKYDLFFRLWTLKESYMKATGYGFKLSPKNICINETDFYFKEFDFGDGYKYAVCSKIDDFNGVEFLSFKERMI